MFLTNDKAKESETLNGDSLRSIDKQKYGCFRKFQSCKGVFLGINMIKNPHENTQKN